MRIPSTTTIPAAIPTTIAHRSYPMMGPRSPLSPSLLSTDSSVLFAYSLSSSITDLFREQGYLEPSLTTSAQDVVDIVLAFDRGSALALGWVIAAAATGIASESWLTLDSEDHERAPLGVSGLLLSWIIAWPLGQVFKAAAFWSVFGSGWAASIVGSTSAPNPSFLPSSAMLDDPLSLEALVRDLVGAIPDGAGTLITMILWRRFLLWRGEWWQ